MLDGPFISFGSRLALLVATSLGVAAASLAAQDRPRGDRAGRTWQLDGLQDGFCVQMLVQPAKLGVKLPGDLRPLRADAVTDLSPALSGVVRSQPEFAGWSPSALCLYWIRSVDVGSLRVHDDDPTKAPLLAIWTMAAGETDSRARRDVALQLLTNSSALARAAEVQNLDLERIRSSIGQVPQEEGPPRPDERRYQLRFPKSTLIWDGRTSRDSTASHGEVLSVWGTAGRGGKRVDGRITLSPETSRAMIGSLRIEGKDALASALQASPIRFVSATLRGGKGQLWFDR